MFDLQKMDGTERHPDNGLITEATRRVMKLPQFAGAEPDVVREMVKREIDQGNITLYGVLRAVRRAI